MDNNLTPAQSPSSPVGEEYVPDPRRWRILSVILVAMFMSLVAVSIVNVVLPSIQVGLDANESDLQWVLSGYALTFGVILVAAGRAGDLLGRAPLFIIGVAVFTLASVAAGLSPDPLSLNIARFIQGVGSGLLNPQGVGMIQQYFRGKERGRAYGALGSVVGVSVAIGPLIGGFIIQLVGVNDGWRWTFLVNIPFGVLAILLAFMWFPRPLFNKATPGAAKPDRDLDPVGTILLGAAVLALLFPFVERTSGSLIWGLVPFGGILLATWVWWEQRYKTRGRSPMVDIAIFKTNSFSVGTLIAGLYFLGITGVWVLIAMYIQNGLGHSALIAGTVGLPAAIMSAFTSAWAGNRVMVKGRKIIIAGIISALIGLVTSVVVVQLVAATDLSYWWLAVTLSFIGMAQGLVITPNQTLTLADVPLEYSGSAGGILQTGQRIGTAMGLAIITGIAFSVLDKSDWTGAISVGFGAISVIVVITLIVALLELRDRKTQLQKL
ncbi:MFS transporter [Jonesiaceae bacterium BS-20]|uniref:MFS transporter n=1 Tax=Jonesiaceae bacterium BS-20 TaxID=3120821 RepID=A0AAU7DSF3_9MICO